MARWKCTPIGGCRHHFPRRGKSTLRSASKLISNSRHSAAKTSPSGGGAVGRRGAFPTRQRRGCMVFQRAKRVWLVFPRAKPGCKGFIILAPNIFEGAHHLLSEVMPPFTQPAAGGGHNLPRQRRPFFPSYRLSRRCLNLIPLNPVTFRKYPAIYSEMM